MECHKTIKEHVPREDLTGELGKAFLEQRCASCHREHKGTQLAPRAQQLCASCHMQITAAAPNAQSKDVGDFSRADSEKAHPEFRLSLVDADQPRVVRRVRQGTPRSADMIERSNLKFSHEKHLDPRGVNRDARAVNQDPSGVRHPKKGRVVLNCADCHQPADGGRLMAPVTMQRHCQECHSLAFEREVTERQVPHGSAEAVVTMLREFYARLVLGDVPPDVRPPPDFPRMRPGAVLDYQDRQQALRIADARVQLVLRELFEARPPRQVCSLCHHVSRQADGAWKVAPVKVATEWMPRATFTHAKHATEKCSSCHDVSRSKDSRDIAMPDIARCRQCHVGARAIAEKVTSDCATCHEFHAGRDYWHKALQTDLRSRAIK